MKNIELKEIGYVDIEWSKKLLKKVVLYCDRDTKIKFNLQSAIKSFRVRKSRRDKGRFLLSSDLIGLDKGKTYFFDRFKK